MAAIGPGADMDRMVGRARAAFGVRRAALFRLDRATGTLTCVASDGDGGAAGWVGQTLPAGVGMAGRAVAQRRAVSTPDLLADARVPIAPWLRERMEAEGLRAVAAAPVGSGDEIIGALGILDAAGRRFSDDELASLARLAAGEAATR
jgi:GAF domain-containing protein